MDLVRIYECLCDETRLRVLHLLTRGPLCVCHLQAILGEPQVKVSKHLGYLKARGMVECRRNRNWMVYGLPKKKSPELAAHLKCLQDCAAEQPQLKADLKARLRIGALIAEATCCPEAGQKANAGGQDVESVR